MQNNECQILLCHAPAVARITIPLHAPKFRVCGSCQQRWLDWARLRGAITQIDCLEVT